MVRASPAPVQALNPVGSGDAFLGGLAVGLVQGQGWPETLRLASAVAGLAASRFEPDVGPEPELGPLLDRVQVEKL
jgi:sugar/nucleoside kinase (ribokinase family)